MNHVNDQPIYYARFNRRFRLAIIDTFVNIAIFCLCALIINLAEPENLIIRLAILFGPVLMFEPILVSYKDLTDGHYILNQKIISAKTGELISFSAAMSRFILKNILGFLSVIFILSSAKGQAIHDQLADTVVIIRFLGLAGLTFKGCAS